MMRVSLDRKSRSGSSSSSSSDEEEKSYSRHYRDNQNANYKQKSKFTPKKRKFKEDEIEEVKINKTGKNPSHKVETPRNRADSVVQQRRTGTNFDSLTTKSHDKNSNTAPPHIRGMISGIGKLSSSPSARDREERIEEIKSDDDFKDKSRLRERNDEEADARFSKIEQSPRNGYQIRKKNKSLRRQSNQA